jgi:hypothetical protein
MSNVVVSECPDLSQVSFDDLLHVVADEDVIEPMIGQPDLDRQEQQR